MRHPNDSWTTKKYLKTMTTTEERPAHNMTKLQKHFMCITVKSTLLKSSANGACWHLLLEERLNSYENWKQDINYQKNRKLFLVSLSTKMLQKRTLGIVISLFVLRKMPISPLLENICFKENQNKKVCIMKLTF